MPARALTKAWPDNRRSGNFFGRTSLRPAFFCVCRSSMTLGRRETRLPFCLGLHRGSVIEGDNLPRISCPKAAQTVILHRKRSKPPQGHADRRDVHVPAPHRLPGVSEHYTKSARQVSSSSSPPMRCRGSVCRYRFVSVPFDSLFRHSSDFVITLFWPVITKFTFLRENPIPGTFPVYATFSPVRIEPVETHQYGTLRS